MTTPLTKKNSSQPRKARKEQAPRAQGSPASGERSGSPDCILCGRPPHPDSHGHSYLPREQRSEHEDPKEVLDRLAPRGQQQECVEAIVKWVVEDMKACNPQMTRYDDHCLRKEVSFQVNAALTDERQAKVKDGLNSDKIIAQLTDQLADKRQRYQDARDLWNVAEGEPHSDWISQMQTCISDLRTERQRREQAEKEFEELRTLTLERYLTNEQKRMRDRLLSALVAIDKHNKECEHYNNPNWAVKVDLSLLHKHDAELLAMERDRLANSEWHKGWAAAIEAGESNKERLIAEVQEPFLELVELLKKYQAGLAPIVQDALAKVKER